MKYIEKIEKKNAILLARECIGGWGPEAPNPPSISVSDFFYSRLKKNKNRTKFFGTKRFIETKYYFKAMSTKHGVTGNC